MARKELVVKEFSGQAKAFAIAKSHIQELTIFLVDNVVIANELLTLLLLRHNILSILLTRCKEGEADTDKTFLNEVKLRDFLILLIYYTVVIISHENSGHEPEGDIAQKLSFVQHIEVKKSGKRLENVFE